MKLFHFVVAASSVLLVPAVALAQTAAPAAAPAAAGPALEVGTIVYDQQGAEVGKIASVSGDVITIDTGNHKAGLPKSAFGAGAKGPTVTITKVQIDAQVAAAMEQAAGALQAALVPGAQVYGKSGTLIGTIKQVNGEQVIIDRPSGSVSLTKSAFSVGAQGLTISVTAAELEAAAKAAAAGA